MLSTLGGTLTGIVVLACSLAIVTLSICFGVVLVRRFSTPASLATKKEPAPSAWESRLAELEADVVSLSSSFDKVTKVMRRHNSREGMRELRSARAASDDPPPVTASKAEKFRHYGLAGKTPREIAAHQLSLVDTKVRAIASEE